MGAVAVANANVITLAPEAVDVLHECERMLDEARNVWCSGTDIPWAQVEAGLAEDMIRERLARVAEMERSLRTCLVRLFAGPQMFDGPLTIHRDGPLEGASLFWSYTNKHERERPYHGGMIFHPNRAYPNARVGTWSLHT